MKLKSSPLNIKEFSSIAGVSTATVSRVFSNKNTVTEKTRKKIQMLAREYGFRPNQVAKSSFGGKTRSIGVLLCRLTNSYFADIAVGIQKVMLSEDYLPIIIDIREDGERGGIKRLIDHRVDGVIISIADQTLTTHEMQEIVRFELPVVTVDSSHFESTYDNVCSDDYNGGQLAGEYLIRCGHRKIAFFSNNSSGTLAELRRLSGFRDTLAEADIVLKKEDIIEKKSSDQGPLEIQTRLAAYMKEKRPTAIYAFNDIDALTVYRVAENNGLRIPDDLSIIGHADLAIASAMSPPLTTVKQNGDAVGVEAARLMLERLNGFDGEARKKIQSVKLIERNSVKTFN